MLQNFHTGNCYAVLHIRRERDKNSISNITYEIVHLFVSEEGLLNHCHEILLLAFISFADTKKAETYVQYHANSFDLTKVLLIFLGFLRSDACTLYRPPVCILTSSSEHLKALDKQIRQILQQLSNYKPDSEDKSVDHEQNTAASKLLCAPNRNELELHGPHLPP